MQDPKEIVEAHTVLQAVGSTSVQPTFVQLAGLWLAAGVGALIAVVTLCVLGFLYFYYPSMPPAESLKDAAVAKEMLANYKELSGIAVKSAQDIFTTIVVSALLPVLTAILGYIFGRAGKDDGGQ
jgi:uncharacterized membrane protein